MHRKLVRRSESFSESFGLAQFSLGQWYNLNLWFSCTFPLLLSVLKSIPSARSKSRLPPTRYGAELERHGYMNKMDPVHPLVLLTCLSCVLLQAQPVGSVIKILDLVRTIAIIHVSGHQNSCMVLLLFLMLAHALLLSHLRSHVLLLRRPTM